MMVYSLALLIVATLAIASPTKKASTLKRDQLPNGIGKLPALGWNSWNAYHGDINASIIESTAKLFVSLELNKAGYEYVNMDDYWGAGSRDSKGQLQADSTKFPEGIAGVVTNIHSLGLKAGIYSSASVATCGGYPASLGHETTDAATFASWGIDYLKYDNCLVPSKNPGVEFFDEYDYCTPENGANAFNGKLVVNGSCAVTSRTAPAGYDWTKSNTYARYSAMSEALLAQENPILFSMCNWGWADVRSWGASLASSWRVVCDIQSDWNTVMGTLNEALFMSKSVDFYVHNDLDILEVGNGMLTEECRSHFALWAAMKSPLLIGTDLASLSSDLVAILKNSYLLAFNQDTVYGKPALPFNWDWSWNRVAPSAHYWSGQSSAGTLVLMFNPSDNTETMTAKWADVPGLTAGALYETTDIWTNETTCVATGFTSSVIRHDTAGALIGKECSSSGAVLPAPSLSAPALPSGGLALAPASNLSSLAAAPTPSAFSAPMPMVPSGALAVASASNLSSLAAAPTPSAFSAPMPMVPSGALPVASATNLSSLAAAPTPSGFSAPMPMVPSGALPVASGSNLSSLAAVPTPSSSAASNAGATSAGPQPINKQYQSDVLATIGILTPLFDTTSKTWQSIKGYQAATVYQDLVDYKYWTGDTSQDAFGDSLFDIVTDYGLLNSVGAIDEFNDDRSWWMLAFLHAYRNTGHAEYLNQSITQFNQIVASSQLSASDAGTTPNKGGVARSIQIPASCDVAGSLYWEQTPDSLINAIATGLIAQVGAMLYGITKQESFRTAADFALSYERRVMLSTDGIVNVDHMEPSSCTMNGGELCYNTGVYLDACTHLYQATGESKYLDWATLSVTTGLGGVFGNDDSAPLVIDQDDNSPDSFFSALTEYYVMIKSMNINTDLQTKIKAFVKVNRDYVAANAKQSNGLYTVDWIGHKGGGTEWGTGSVLSLYMAAMIML